MFFAFVYAITWNGCYLHDGPTFLLAVESGEWLHVHMAYLGATHALAWLKKTRRFCVSAGTALLLTLLLAPGERARLSADPDRAWAEDVASHLPPESTVLCLGLSRKMRIMELTSAQAVDFLPAGDQGAVNADAAIAAALRAAAEDGRAVYLDPRVLAVGPRVPTLAPVLESLRRSAVLVPAAGGRLVRLENREGD